MIEKQMLKLMLSKKFYTQHKGQISRNVFQGSFGSLFETIQKAHEKYDTDISVDELYTLHKTVYNPALTRAAKDQFKDLLKDIKQTTEPSELIAEDIVRILADRNIAQQVAVEATEIYNGKEANFDSILGIIEKHKQGLPGEKLDSVTTNIGELLNQLEVTTKWKFNIPRLQQDVSGIGPGNFAIFFARPEVGKTAFWISLVGNQGGFAYQGAKIHAFINEEPAIRTQMRLINSCSGMTREEIIENIKLAHGEWSKIKDNITLLDVVDWSMDNMDSHCEKYKPDIIIIDQLDKVGIAGKFARTDEKLRAIYTGARELAKRRQCAVIAISQASADAHGKTENITFDMMENSKTGKAAEADLIIAIGTNTHIIDHTNTNRVLNISKNKITGFHGMVGCTINTQLSRYWV